MHSRIFQISKQPIGESDYIEESRYWDHWFTNSHADYVSDETNRAGDIEWLRSCYSNRELAFGIDDGGEYFTIEDKTKYFAPKFEEFQKIIKQLTDSTLDNFATAKLEMDVYRLNSAYEDKHGFYVDGDSCGLCSLDDFIRWNDKGEKFYIGATIDYHF